MAITARRPGEEESGVQMSDAAANQKPLLTEIDHIAIAVPDLGAAIDYYRETFGAVVDHREIVENPDP
jgi:methylmalonyl-CoA/ethylmalonyl-CoA epimerase